MEEHRLVSGDSGYGQVLGFCEKGNENLSSIKWRKSFTSWSPDKIILDLKTNSDPWSWLMVGRLISESVIYVGWLVGTLDRWIGRG